MMRGWDKTLNNKRKNEQRLSLIYLKSLFVRFYVQFIRKIDLLV